MGSGMLSKRFLGVETVTSNVAHRLYNVDSSNVTRDLRRSGANTQYLCGL